MKKLKKPTPLEIVKYIESTQNLSLMTSGKTKLISIKVPEALLKAFKLKCEGQGLRYQTQIKKLMMEWLVE